MDGSSPHAGAGAELRAQPGLGRRVVAEGVGTALLLAAVVGSGIMGERLAGGNVAIALLANTLATGAALLAVPAFVAAQLLGAGAATLLFRWLTPALPQRAAEVLVPHRPEPEKTVNEAAERVIFACVQNAGRSQMAAAFFNALATPGKAHAFSAGTRPADVVHPEVVSVMREVGLDVSAARPQRLTAHLARGARLLVTMGCGDECPILPGTERDDWPLEDPKGQPLERVREIREEIRRRVVGLLAAHGWQR